MKLCAISLGKKNPLLENGQENLYIDSYSHLSEINGINFTRREVDIISCILSGRGAKKTASLLEISPKTADAHIRNIMLKLGCNSRERIIDFFERSGKQHYIKQHYANLHNDTSLGPDFDSQQATITNTPFELPENERDTCERQSQYWKTTVTSLVIGVVCLGFWAFRPTIYSKETATYSIKSDLPIPNDAVLLERSWLIKDINTKLLRKSDGIQTVALIQAKILDKEDFPIQSDLIVPVESALLNRSNLINQIDTKLKKK